MMSGELSIKHVANKKPFNLRSNWNQSRGMGKERLQPRLIRRS